MIVALTGGIGNQMFQYAFGRALQEKNKEELILDTYWYRKDKLRGFALENYGISCAGVKEHERYNRLRLKVQRIPLLAKLCGIHKEVREYHLDPFARHVSYDFYCGYWQNYRYFENIREKLCAELTYQGQLSLQEDCLREQIAQSDSIGIHVRRGDYLVGVDKDIYSQVPISYYEKALRKVLENYSGDESAKGEETSSPMIYCFSDDIPWCQEALKELEKDLASKYGARILYMDSELSSGADVDLLLMRSGKHLITANSTFSWWAAWLNEREDKQIMVPDSWMQNPRKNKILIDALIPSSWEIIS